MRSVFNNKERFNRQRQNLITFEIHSMEDDTALGEANDTKSFKDFQLICIQCSEITLSVRSAIKIPFVLKLQRSVKIYREFKRLLRSVAGVKG